MWLIVGLGNPGHKYQRNRHNIGFRVVEELALRHSFGEPRQRFGGQVWAGGLSVAGRPHKAILLEPMEFMNRSGYAVQRAAHFYDIAAEDMVVIHDDIDIDFGRIKLKQGGGHGGHNGLRSIIQELGSKEFYRVRVGVGKPGPPPDEDAPETAARVSARDQRVVGHVLSDFPGALSDQVEELIGRAGDATEALVAHGLREAMNKFHEKR